MERDQEIQKLVNVLRRTSRMALQAEWTGNDKGASAFCAGQYNRVLARLREIDQGLSNVFEPLPQDSSLTVTAMACRQLVAFYEDELGPGARFARAYGIAFDPESFKEFWQKSGREIEDLGEFIRESIAEWTRHRKGRGHRCEGAKPTC